MARDSRELFQASRPASGDAVAVCEDSLTAARHARRPDKDASGKSVNDKTTVIYNDEGGEWASQTEYLAMMNPDQIHSYVDEAGDPTLFGSKRGSGVIVGNDGCSRFSVSSIPRRRQQSLPQSTM